MVDPRGRHKSKKRRKRKKKPTPKSSRSKSKGQRAPSLAFTPPPARLTAFSWADRVRPKTARQGGGGLRARWKDLAYIYEWDSQHGTVEKYDAAGFHLGEFDPKTGAQLKLSKAGRKVEP